MTNRPRRQISPALLDEITDLLGQQATRELSMAHAFRASGRPVQAQHHESRAVAFEGAAALLREQVLLLDVGKQT